eukprot:c46036_g1_i1 orf=167-460(-)
MSAHASQTIGPSRHCLQIKLDIQPLSLSHSQPPIFTLSHTQSCHSLATFYLSLNTYLQTLKPRSLALNFPNNAPALMEISHLSFSVGLSLSDSANSV